MATNEWVSKLTLGAGAVLQFIVLFWTVSSLLRFVPERPPRWAHLTGLRWTTASMSDRWLERLRLSRAHPVFVEREALLGGCGFDGDAALYIACRRIALVAMPVLAGVASIGWLLAAKSWPPIALFGGGAALFLICRFDLAWLRSIHRVRAQRITKEVHVISNQLLYFAGANLHLHTKLSRCVPFAKVLQSDMQRLLAEWYHDAEEALRRFKLRLGTEDGASFVETLDSLRLHESEEFYSLLRQRIQDYKEKLELAKESRKETTSYALFVVAGIPILYTFQVFIYPWVREGQKLFESLGS
ncbi:conserved hypothetical protein [Paenibacillus curdlanolyticus YK9]|uniref:Type II secretion system F domain protein n=1 Tax=Paenibacillus curdlanolyticus YK9 TaxID=717606 RepID=E0I715_9BACL|nr:hypothetical protein [Paenibacillus curdlanolyticus]EFM11831.1 conserved hypothetical protein [Paenibacillus curdlanolyticus YK9]